MALSQGRAKEARKQLQATGLSSTQITRISDLFGQFTQDAGNGLEFIFDYKDFPSPDDNGIITLEDDVTYFITGTDLSVIVEALN